MAALTAKKNGMWLISLAFSWPDSPQGYDFWYELHQKWQALLFNRALVKDLYIF